MLQKPRNIDEYKSWLKDKHGIEISDRVKTRYDAVSNTIKRDYEKSDFWIKIVDSLAEYDQDYRMKKGYNLFLGNAKPELDIKTFDSFLLKTFRKNVLNNKNFPDEPQTGWILPDNWFSQIDDIVRTLFVVKYLDGVEFLKGKIKSHCEECGMDYREYLEAREEGYYAAHLYTRRRFDIPREDWDTTTVQVSVELQITTQLQEAIRLLLHKFYESRRLKIEEKDLKWQWDYTCDEFSANYLGHILHYVEGMIMEIREKQKEKTA